MWAEWPEGLKSAFVKEPGLLDNSALVTFLRDTISQFPDGYQRKITIAAADVESGEYHTFDELNTPVEHLYDAAVSSSSIQMIFPPHYYNGHYYMDGGSVWGINVDSAIKKCLEVVDDASKITIDILICGDAELPDYDTTSTTTFKNYQRGK